MQPASDSKKLLLALNDHPDDQADQDFTPSQLSPFRGTDFNIWQQSTISKFS